MTTLWGDPEPCDLTGCDRDQRRMVKLPLTRHPTEVEVTTKAAADLRVGDVIALCKGITVEVVTVEPGKSGKTVTVRYRPTDECRDRWIHLVGGTRMTDTNRYRVGTLVEVIR